MLPKYITAYIVLSTLVISRLKDIRITSGASNLPIEATVRHFVCKILHPLQYQNFSTLHTPHFRSHDVERRLIGKILFSSIQRANPHRATTSGLAPRTSTKYDAPSKRHYSAIRLPIRERISASHSASEYGSNDIRQSGIRVDAHFR